MQADAGNAKTVVDNTLTDSATMADHTFYELLTLAHPFDSKSSLEQMLSAVMTEAVPHAYILGSATQPMVPADLGWFAQGGLAKDPAQRYASVDAMFARLRKRAEGDIPVQCQVTFMMRYTAKMKRAFAIHPFRSAGLASLLFLWLLATTVYTMVHALRG